MAIKAAIFDLDNTLVSHRAQLKRFIEFQYRAFGILSQVPFSEWEREFLLFDDDGYVTKEVVYAQLTQQFNLKPSLASHLYEHFLTYFHKFVAPVCGLRETLEGIKAKGVRTAVITNGGYTVQRNKIEELGIQGLMDAILISEQEGVAKPNSEIFLRCADQLHLAPRECLYTGDNPVNDIIGARAAGMSTAWIRMGRMWPRHLKNPNYVINSIRDVGRLVAGPRFDV